MDVGGGGLCGFAFVIASFWVVNLLQVMLCAENTERINTNQTIHFDRRQSISFSMLLP